MRVKRFAPRVLTLSTLNAFLDTLESMEGFIPDVLLIDYPALMRMDPKNLRIEMGHTLEGIKQIAVERNLAACVVHQASREGAKARVVRSTHASEDWTIIQTSDVVLTYSASETEKKQNLARLAIEKSRSDRDRFMVLISQNYDVGSFCHEAWRLPDNYWEYIDHIDEDDDTLREDESYDDEPEDDSDRGTATRPQGRPSRVAR